MMRVITKPIVDLRKEPRDLFAMDFSYQELRDSQILFGEKVWVEEQRVGWLKIKAVEQSQCHTSGCWDGYSGWIREDETFEVITEEKPSHCVHTLWTNLYDEKYNPIDTKLSLGTYLVGEVIKNEWFLITTLKHKKFLCKLKDLKPIPTKKNEKRAAIIATSKQLLNQPYLWGGRGAWESQTYISSVDCSGLVNLSYRVHGIEIPRDAHDQYLKSTLIPFNELRPADLWFFQGLDKTRISHVVMYLGNRQFIEAPQTGSIVRIVSAQEISEQRKLTHRFFYGTMLD